MDSHTFTSPFSAKWNQHFPRRKCEGRKLSPRLLTPGADPKKGRGHQSSYCTVIDPLLLKTLPCITVRVPGPTQAATLLLPFVLTPVSDQVALILYDPPGSVTMK